MAQPESKRLVTEGALDANIKKQLDDPTSLTAIKISSIMGEGGIYRKDFSFASPALEWVCQHDFGHALVDVTTFDQNGNQIMGDVSYLDANTVVVRWYFPFAGSATVQR